MTMKRKPKQEFHYRQKVWVNPTTETIRKEECLCHNCDNLKTDKLVDNCTKAEALFQIIQRENVALIITRCPAWKPKDEK
jgi:hypothetical protein